MNRQHYSGGAPVIGDAPALDLVNTLHTPRGVERDGVSSAADLNDWIAAVQPDLGLAGQMAHVSEADVARFHDLRRTIRSLVGSVSRGETPASTDVDRVNEVSRLAASWPELRITAEAVERTSAWDAPGADIVLASLAHDAVDLLTGDRAATLRTCEAHNCSLFFLKDHPRREWCSPACGARVRSARAYARRTAESASA